jgi:hypothetical protein
LSKNKKGKNEEIKKEKVGEIFLENFRKFWKGKNKIDKREKILFSITAL